MDSREAIAAALLHDAVNLPKDSAERAEASVRSAVVARRWLPEHGFDDAAVARVAESRGEIDRGEAPPIAPPQSPPSSDPS